nr:transposase [uncultured Desulfobulbus sp.]
MTETKGKLRLFYLPPYSPKLNLDELVWNYLKNNHIGRMPYGGKKEFHNVKEHQGGLPDPAIETMAGS